MIHIQKTAPGPPMTIAVATPREVARADAARQRDGEGLERGDVPFAAGCRAGRFAQHADHLAQHPELHAPVRSVNQTAQHSSAAMSRPHSRSLIRVIQSLKSSMIEVLLPYAAKAMLIFRFRLSADQQLPRV